MFLDSLFYTVCSGLRLLIGILDWHFCVCDSRIICFRNIVPDQSGSNDYVYRGIFALCITDCKVIQNDG